MMPGTAGTRRLVAAAFALLILMPSYGLAEDDCDPWFEVTIGNEEESNTQRDYFFNVEISISSDCAVVHYELVIETENADGEPKTERMPGRIKLHDQQEMTQVLQYSMPLDHYMTSYSAELSSCESC